MVFDWTVNLGNVIQFLAFIAGGIALFFAMRADIQMLRIDVNYLKEEQAHLHESFSQLGSILTQVAVQDTRINMIEKSIDELRHGQGFIGNLK